MALGEGHARDGCAGDGDVVVAPEATDEARPAADVAEALRPEAAAQHAHSNPCDIVDGAWVSRFHGVRRFQHS